MTLQAISPTTLDLDRSCPSASASPAVLGRRRSRELKTMVAMIRCYCEARHDSKGVLCAECQSLLDYATIRLDRCRFGEAKPTCANCPIHCYQPARREQVKAVMRYAGPRMLWRHPILVIRHMLDGYKKVTPVSIA